MCGIVELSQAGGGVVKTHAAKWTKTTRKVIVEGVRGKPDTKKTVYRNTTTGELRVCKMAARKDGTKRASYVKF